MENKRENAPLIVLVVGCFIGIWHALPLTNVIYDEMYFVGGVLRAIQAKSVLPLAGDVPYGLLTFWLNYAIFAVLLLFLFAGLGFRATALKAFVLKQANWLYLVPRVLNATIAVGMVCIMKDILSRAKLENRKQIFLLFVLFTNLITASVLHTGKMWVLSVCLVLLSIRSLYRSVSHDAASHSAEWDILYSVMFAFLAFANFPLCGFALIVLPLLWYFHGADTRLRMAILRSAAIGTGVFVVLFLCNSRNIIDQVTDIFTTYHPVVAATSVHMQKISLWSSLILHAVQVILLFPLPVFLLCIGCVKGIKDRPLFLIGASYTLTYFTIITLLVTWSSDVSANLRYLFPFGFFLVLMVASLTFSIGRTLYILCGVLCIPYLLLLYRLSVPTTYNQAVEWVVTTRTAPGTVIENEVGPMIDIPKDKRSYLLMQEKFCGTKCHETLSASDGAVFPYVVIDAESTTTLPAFTGDTFRITVSPYPLPGETLAQTFFIDASTSTTYEVDYNVGNYFDPQFYRIRRFGDNLYVYRRSGR